MKKNKKLIGLILVLIMFGIILYSTLSNYDNNKIEYCLDHDHDSILMSRVPLNNPIEEEREFYYNSTWIKLCGIKK